MEQDITTTHGTGTIIIPDTLPGDGAFIIIHGLVGDSAMDSAMDGSAGDFIHTEEDYGDPVDTTGDTGTDIIEDTGEVTTVDTAMEPGLDMQRANAVQTVMYITIEVQE